MHSYSGPALAIIFCALWDVNWELEENVGIFREKKNTNLPNHCVEQENKHPSVSSRRLEATETSTNFKP